MGVNKDGRIEVFIRYDTDLDVWQYYQEDASNPTSWVGPRECSCLTGCDGVHYPSPQYWNTQPVFPTSDLNILTDAATGALKIVYRGFDGRMYSLQQRTPGNSALYTAPQPLGDAVFE